MDSIWNYMLGEVHKQSGLEGLRIKLISLVQDTREGTKPDSGDIDMEVRNVTQYVVTEDEFNQIMQALKQKDRDYVFYQEWRSGGTQIGDNIIAYDAGNGDLVLIKQGQSLRGYSGEIMAAVQLPGALIMLTNSATWALGKRMDWQYNSDLSAQIYSYLGCTAMDAFCTTRGHFVEIE